MDEYDVLLARAVKEATARGIVPIGTERVETLQLLKDLDTETLLGRASRWSGDMKKLLFSGIYSGASIQTIVNGMEGISLASHQMNVAVNTGLRQFSDLSRYSVFKVKMLIGLMLDHKIIEQGQYAPVLTQTNQAKVILSLK